MRPLPIFAGLLLLWLLPAAGAIPALQAPIKARTESVLVIAVEGDVRAGNRRLAAGASLAAGDELRAGQAGHVRLQLADGSTVSFWGPGSMALDRIRALPSAKGTDVSLRLILGRIEATIRGLPHAGARFEVKTASAVAITRGALFRISAPQPNLTTCEVAEGSVQVAGSGNPVSVEVAQGRGTRVVAGRPPMKPVQLLPAPYLWTGIQLVEQKRAEIPFSPLEGAAAYRMIVSPGGNLYRHLLDEKFQVPRLRIAELADGDYFVRVRAIDEFGLEGAGTVLRMRVHLRPDPPSPALPPEHGRLYGTSAELSWLPDPAAIGYVAQLAQDDVFRVRLQEWNVLREPKVVASGLHPGSYYWRVASVLKDGSQSRFSTVRTFRVDPLPAPLAAPVLEGEALRFAWSGQPGQIFDLQVAADPRFQLIVAERHTNRASVELPRPLQGAYFARLRTTELDGTVKPFTDAVRFEIPGRGSATEQHAAGPACLVEGERGLCAVYAPPATLPR